MLELTLAACLIVAITIAIVRPDWRRTMLKVAAGILGALGVSALQRKLLRPDEDSLHNPPPPMPEEDQEPTGLQEHTFDEDPDETHDIRDAIPVPADGDDFTLDDRAYEAIRRARLARRAASADDGGD